MITAIGMVKNEADVIESMIRCNSSIIDNFVLFDNMSTDRTTEILNSLKKEGFQIEVIPDNVIAYSQRVKLTNLLYYCKEKYGSKIYIPLDADEIIFAPDPNLSVEEIKYYLNGISNSRVLLHLKNRLYFPFDTDNAAEISIPKRLTYYFDESTVEGYKCIIPSRLLEDDSFRLEQGSHSGIGDLIENKKFQPDLLLAHYPCRSAEQVTSKAIVGWLANLAYKNGHPLWAYQWKNMFNTIKSGLPVDKEQVKAMVLQYLGDTSREMVVRKKMISLPEECFDIRYTKLNEFDALQNLIQYCREMADKAGTSVPPQYSALPVAEKERQEALVSLCVYAEKLATDFAESVVED